MQKLRNLTRKYYNPTNFKIENMNQPIISRRTEKSNAAKLIQQRFRENINNSSMSAKSRKKKCLKQLKNCRENSEGVIIDNTSDTNDSIEEETPYSYYEKKARIRYPLCGKQYNKCMNEESDYIPDSNRPSYYGI